MFPVYLDNAKVLYYTVKNDYGQVLYTDGSVASVICYYAICKYDNDDRIYLFGCDEKQEVVSDYECDSIEECKDCASQLSGEAVLVWNKKE